MPDKMTTAILLDGDSSNLEFYAATELQRYLMELFGISPAIVRDPNFEAGTFFVLGTPQSNSVGAAAPAGTWKLMHDQGFVLRRSSHRDRPAMLVAAKHPRAVLWGVYELLEHYGVRYLITEDVFPVSPGAFHLPQLDVVMNPVFQTRAWRGINVFAMGPESWSLEEYRQHTDQLAKLKFSTYVLNVFTHHPFVHYSIRGQPRTSGEILHGWRMPIDESWVGMKRFGGKAEFWNAEFADAHNYQEKIAAGHKLVHGLIEYANLRGLDTTMTVSLMELPRQFKTPENGYEQSNWKIPPDVTNPITYRNASTVLKAHVDTYPEIDQLMLLMSEHRHSVAGVEKCWNELDRKYDLNAIITLEQVLDQARQRTSYPGGGERAAKETAGDIESLYFIDKIFNEMNPLADTARPDMKLNFVGLSEELNPILHKVLPEGSEIDMLVDYVASAVAKRLGAFETVSPDVPAIHTMALQDDNVGVISQLTTGSIEKAVGAMKANGWKGFMARLWTARDVDPCIAYLARASWDSAVTSEAVYADHVEKICGPDCPQVIEAFEKLEEVTKVLDAKYIGVGFPVPEKIKSFWSAAKPDPGLIEVAQGYQKSLDLLNVARNRVTDRGQAYLDYYIARLLFSRNYMTAAHNIQQAGCAAREADSEGEKQSDGDWRIMAEKRKESHTRMQQTVALLRSGIESVANVVTSDARGLGLLATLNEYFYKPALSFAHDQKLKMDAEQGAIEL